MNPRRSLICTVGTSLFRPNLEGLKLSLDKGACDERLDSLAEA